MKKEFWKIIRGNYKIWKFRSNTFFRKYREEIKLTLNINKEIQNNFSKPSLAIY